MESKKKKKSIPYHTYPTLRSHLAYPIAIYDMLRVRGACTLDLPVAYPMKHDFFFSYRLLNGNHV